MDFCILDTTGFQKSEPAWTIIKYGDVPDVDKSVGFYPLPVMVNSSAPKLGLTNLLTKSSIYFATSASSSEMEIEFPETGWFINDKTNKTIVFQQWHRQPEEWTWADCAHAMLPQTELQKKFAYAFQKIGKLSKLSNNWDSYSAKAIDRNAISHAVAILKKLLELGLSRSIQVPVPFVAPLSSGGLQMEWEKDDRYLELSINEETATVDFFAMDQAKEGELTLEGVLRSSEHIEQLLAWFLGGAVEDLARLSFEDSYDDWEL